MLKGMLIEFIFWYMSKDDAINIMNGFNLIHKMGVLQFFYHTFFVVLYKNEWEY